MSQQINSPIQPEYSPFVVRVTEEHTDGVTLEVTEEDYQRDLAAGIPTDELMKPGKHKFRRVPPEKVFKRREMRIRTDIYLDGDILHYFLERAQQEGIEEYQQVINDTLRRVMERDQAEREKIKVMSPAAQELLADENFVSALKEMLRDAA